MPCFVCSRQPTFDLDPAALEKRYKLLQWQLHPDKAGQKSPQEQEYSAEQASLINQAYGVLRNPLSRANYLVSSSAATAALTHRTTSGALHHKLQDCLNIFLDMLAYY